MNTFGLRAQAAMQTTHNLSDDYHNPDPNHAFIRQILELPFSDGSTASAAQAVALANKGDV